MPFKFPKISAFEMAVLRRALDHSDGLFVERDRSAAASLARWGLAVPVDSHGRVIFIRGVYAVLRPDMRIPASPCGTPEYFITPIGRERARFAADVFDTHGDLPDPSMMEDL